MRDCALWISPWVARDQEVIVDTSAMTDQEWRAAVHNDPDAPPKDTVLVVIHPARHMDLLDAVLTMSPLRFMDSSDANGRHIAEYLIDKHCYRNPELRRRLRW